VTPKKQRDLTFQTAGLESALAIAVKDKRGGEGRGGEGTAGEERGHHE